MRRRRAENVHGRYAQWLGIPEGSDRARVQAIVVAAIGHSLRALALDTGMLEGPELLAIFAETGTGVFI
jgi:stage V sporulation protein SpoVS